MQGITGEANAANGEILVDINGYLSENIIRDMSGECLQILEEKIEVSMENMQFSSDSYVILEEGGLSVKALKNQDSLGLKSLSYAMIP